MIRRWRPAQKCFGSGGFFSRAWRAPLTWLSEAQVLSFRLRRMERFGAPGPASTNTGILSFKGALFNLPGNSTGPDPSVPAWSINGTAAKLNADDVKRPCFAHRQKAPCQGVQHLPALHLSGGTCGRCERHCFVGWNAALCGQSPHQSPSLERAYSAISPRGPCARLGATNVQRPRSIPRRTCSFRREQSGSLGHSGQQP